MNERDTYIARLEAQLKEWSAKIDELQARAERAAADSKLEYDEQIRLLRAHSETLQHRLANLKHTSGNALEDLKVGAERAWNDMRAAVDNAISRLT